MRQQPRAGKRLKKGFTIIEILTVVIIVSLLMTAAIPGYENFVRNNQAFIIASRLEDSLRLAQGEAIRLGIPVSVCPITGFNPTAALNQASEQYPCQNTTTWDAWKVFSDASNNGVENFSNGWPVIQYVGGDIPAGSVVSNVAGRITYDPLGFAVTNPTVTRTSSNWTWSSSYVSGQWTWSYSFVGAYGGSYGDRFFSITPLGCTGNNARLLDLAQNGSITISNIDCYGLF
ncbi:MAG TPA: GspH/FimT family pseudopilin [Gammaproteobacteria bacterium]|nr:GspH/FimT family pseudopilin [Gammaproteobacteria bacterium]